MSPDWFDPLGLRGSKLDPFAFFAGALRGEGVAGQSADLMASTLAKQLVGRRIEIDYEPPISATVERVDEVRPPSMRSATAVIGREVPMWESVAGRLADVHIGKWRIRSIDLQARSLVLVGAAAQRMRVGQVEAQAEIDAEALQTWAGALEGEYRVRVNEGRLEVGDRRAPGWLWLEVSVTAGDRHLAVTPLALRAFGRTVPLLRRFRRPVVRPIKWLPVDMEITAVRVEGDSVQVDGRLRNAIVPVDIAKALTDLGSESTRSVLRIVLGDR
ncbi:MAG: hypothetical protein ACI9C1_002318 [Candidatus Aldehydirespiratoraceae bacterium]|jgi:hypothetical protein